MTPLALLPGMMCDARLFAPQIAAFSGRCTIVCSTMSQPTSVAELAANILATRLKGLRWRDCRWGDSCNGSFAASY